MGARLKRLVAAALCAAAAGCGRGPDTGGDAGVPLDPRPLRTARTLAGGAVALIELDDGSSAPPAALVELATGAVHPLGTGPLEVLGEGPGAATVLGAALQRLDLVTAALAPVDPPAAGRGVLGPGDSYVYPVADGSVALLPLGALRATRFPASDCKVTAVTAVRRYSDAGSGPASGWLVLDTLETCAGAPGLHQRALHPLLRRLTSSGDGVIKGTAAALIERYQPSAGQTAVRMLDLATGAEQPLAQVPPFGYTPGEPLFAFQVGPLAGPFDLVAADLAANRSATLLTGACDGGPMGAMLFPDCAQRRTFTLARPDLMKSIPLCTGQPLTVGRPAPEPQQAAPPPFGITCATDAGPWIAYEWDRDQLRTLAPQPPLGPTREGPVLWWPDGPALRFVTIGSGNPIVTACDVRREGAQSAFSSDGSVAVVPCNVSATDPTIQWFAIGPGPGQRRLLLGGQPGSGWGFFGSSALTPRGRFAFVLAAASGPPAGDPLSCPSGTCTWAIDLRTGGRSRFAYSDIGPPYAAPLVWGDDEDLVLVSQSPRTVIVKAGAGDPEVTSIGVPATGLEGAGADRRFLLLESGAITGPTFRVWLVDRQAGTATAVPMPPETRPRRMGTTNAFVTADGAIDLDTGEVVAFGAGWQQVCFPQTQQLFLDASGSKLSAWRPRAGTSVVIAAGAKRLGGSCDGNQLFLGGFDGTAGALLAIDAIRQLVTPLDARVGPDLIGAGARTFGLADPDVASGELVLIDAAKPGATRLGGRAARGGALALSSRRVAFPAPASAGGGLWAAWLDGSGARAVGPAALQPVFSPDSTRVFASTSEGLLYAEQPGGPAVPIDREVSLFVTSASGEVVLYSTRTPGHTGTWRAALR